MNARIMIAAPKSGSGKTTITCALLKCFMDRGVSISAFKTGPDYIDPMFHKKIFGINSKNLDLFFTDEETTKELFMLDNDSELSVIEGVMGLYDGLGGVNIEASSYHLARTLKTPIILVVDARGMGRSVVAEIAGFLSMDKENLIKGVILNRVSPSIYESLKSLIEHELSISVLGYYKDDPNTRIESRYLGLTLPEEIEDINEKIDRVANAFEETVDFRKIARIAEGASELTVSYENIYSDFARSENTHRIGTPVKIAVAYDRAFCFYYEDNLRLLEQFGAQLVQFSPLKDSRIPDGVSGIIIGGGYPELFAQRLAQNENMKQSIRDAINSGMPSLAECGGFMYLHREIETKEGDAFPMVGAVEGSCFYSGHLSQFGYVRIEDKKGKFLTDEIRNMIRGHEFHYYESTCNGNDCISRKPVGGREWESTHVSETNWWGFAHLYYPSNPQFAKSFVEKCMDWNCHNS